MAKKISEAGLTKKAQSVFNAWIRKRDSGNGCICCGRENATQAGHYLAVKQFGAYRFLEQNCHLCCTYCNIYAQGNIVLYRINLVKKIGAKAVKKLEDLALSHKPHKWTRSELLEIIEKYECY